jgi:L-ascorbate metabolism protein UlaG (beta-lactamase superfamily)
VLKESGEILDSPFQALSSDTKVRNSPIDFKMTDTAGPGLRATFIGVTTILFSNGTDSILIDGFFSRPSLLTTIFWNITSDEPKVRACMQRANINTRLKAVFVAHSHYDHALDAPTVCRETGATLVGSESTRMIGRGGSLPEEQMVVVGDGEVLSFGAFRVTVVEGVHSPGDLSPGEITAPLAYPCAVKAFKTGKCYSYLIEHGEERVFVHPSANYVPGKLEGFAATTLFLGVGVVGKQSEQFRKEYWEHVVAAIGPQKVIPIHWDNFWRSIDLELSPLPWFADKWAVTERYLEDNCSANKIELKVMQAWEVIEI